MTVCKRYTHRKQGWKISEITTKLHYFSRRIDLHQDIKVRHLFVCTIRKFTELNSRPRQIRIGYCKPILSSIDQITSEVNLKPYIQ